MLQCRLWVVLIIGAGWWALCWSLVLRCLLFLRHADHTLSSWWGTESAPPSPLVIWFRVGHTVLLTPTSRLRSHFAVRFDYFLRVWSARGPHWIVDLVLLVQRHGMCWTCMPLESFTLRLWHTTIIAEQIYLWIGHDSRILCLWIILHLLVVFWGMEW